MGIKKAMKGLMGGSKLFVGGSMLNSLVDPGRMFINTKEEEAAENAAENAAKQAAAERAQFEMQQRQLQQANELESSKVLDSVVKVETGAGTDVLEDGTAMGVKKKKKSSTSSSLGVV